ncbi:hypothetical protein L195_g018492, partial [Trifolium pratense]
DIEPKAKDKNPEERDADILPVGKKKRKNTTKEKADNVSTETLPIIPALLKESPPEEQHVVPPDDGGMEDILIKNQVEEESNKIKTCPGSSSISTKKNVSTDNVSTETLPIVHALQTNSPPRISEVQHIVPPDDEGMEDTLIENQVEEESNEIQTCPGSSSISTKKNVSTDNVSTETLSIVHALQKDSTPPRISEVQHIVPPDDEGMEDNLIENQVEEESNEIQTCPGSSSSPQEIENISEEEEDVSMETLESSSSILEMLDFVPLDYGVMDDICKDNEPAFPLNEEGYEDTFNDHFNNQGLLQEENNTHEEIAEEVQECDEEIDECECDDWIVS